MDPPRPTRILHIGETGSTNADAMRLALAGEETPLWVIADRQTAGRGRAGRTWVSPEGNFYASLAVCCSAPLEIAGQLSLVAGISVIDAIRDTTELARDTRLRLKWPNDILVGVAKVGGVLIESTSARGSPGFLAILGFGVNLVSSPDDVGRAATALALYGAVCEPRVLLDALDRQLSDWIGRWEAGSDFGVVRTAWMERAGAIGEPITVNTVRGAVSGLYRGLSATGGLLAEVEGTVREFSHGEVALGGDAGQSAQ